jgi:hypothetical protein
LTPAVTRQMILFLWDMTCIRGELDPTFWDNVLSCTSCMLPPPPSVPPVSPVNPSRQLDTSPLSLHIHTSSVPGILLGHINPWRKQHNAAMKCQDLVTHWKSVMSRKKRTLKKHVQSSKLLIPAYKAAYSKLNRIQWGSASSQVTKRINIAACGQSNCLPVCWNQQVHLLHVEGETLHVPLWNTWDTLKMNVWCWLMTNHVTDSFFLHKLTDSIWVVPAHNCDFCCWPYLPWINISTRWHSHITTVYSKLPQIRNSLISVSDDKSPLYVNSNHPTGLLLWRFMINIVWRFMMNIMWRFMINIVYQW